MKKLICAVAAIAAGAAFAADTGIVSANVVGYANTPLVKGHKGTGLNFVNVSGAKMTLNDLKVVGYEGSYVAGQITLSQLDASGNTLDGRRWTWYDGDVGEPYGYVYGWYDDELNKGDTVELGLGEGVWIQADKDETYSIQVAGQVYNQAVAIQLVKGHALCANPLPTATTLNSAIVSGYGTSYLLGQITCSKLDAAGNTKDGRRWTWYDGDAGEPYGYVYGWYDDELSTGDAEPLAVGEALWVQADKDDTYMLNFAKINL